MNVLIGCEFSGQVREAFRANGHNAYSCDKLPAEGDPRFHIQGDAIDAIQYGCKTADGYVPWDFIGLHYTCTFFANSGVQWLYRRNPDGSVGDQIDHARYAQLTNAADELARLWTAMLETKAKLYFENPTMHTFAVAELVRRMPDWYCHPTQKIQPFEHGHPESKATGLWLHGLPPPLVPTNDVSALMETLPARERGRVHHCTPGVDRWKERSRTLPGIAKAMAAQWGGMEVDFAD